MLLDYELLRTSYSYRLKFYQKHPGWQVIKKHFKGSICVICEKEGLLRPADDVDHIIPLTIAPERCLDIDNCQPLCKGCHSKKTQAENYHKKKKVSDVELALRKFTF